MLPYQPDNLVLKSGSSSESQPSPHPCLAQTIDWPGKHLALREASWDLAVGRVLSTAPQPGTEWPMARALDPSQPGCPGLSPPCSPRPPWLHPSYELPSGLLFTPTRPWEADPSPSRSAGLTGTQPGHTSHLGTEGPARKTLPFWLWAWVSAYILPAATQRLLSPSFLPDSPGAVPHSHAPPTSGFTGRPPTSTSRVFAAF